MGSCFSRALSKAPKANEELEFNKEEASLSQSSDNTAWPQSFRSPSKPLTVVNAPGTFHRKDSDIIRAAKENLRKFPSKSSLKRNYSPDIELALSSSRRRNNTASSSSARSGTGSSVSMSSEGSERNKSLLGFHRTRSSEGTTTTTNNNGSHNDSSHHSHSNGQDSSASDRNHLAPSLQEEEGEGSKEGEKQNSKKSKTTPPPPLNRNVSFCQEVILIQYYK